MPISADVSILLAIWVIVVLYCGGGVEIGASAAALPTYQKVCAGLGIATMNEARAVCQAISPSYFLATPFTAVENAAVTSLLAASQTAILGGSSQTYPNAYSWEDGPRRGETFMVLFSGTAYPASNYYHAFTGTVSFGASYVLAIDSGGWKSYVPGVLGTNCVICEKRLAADVCSVVGTDVVAAGDWLSAASCTCRAGFRSRDCSLQFEAFCDGPFATMDAYNAQCTARGMYLSAPDTAEKRYQVGRSISQHMTINHLLGGSKNVATGFWSWGYGPNTNRSFFDEVTRQNVNFWYTGEAQAGATDTAMVQISGAVWYDQAALPTCYSCQMTSCDLACNTANTLSFTGTTWPSCTCNCKEGFYGATCDCPVYGCYEAGVDTMAWQSGALDSCQCICKPGYFAPYCYPTPTISIGTASVTLSTSSSPTIPLSATRMSESPTNSIQGTSTNALTHTQSTALTASLSTTRRSTSTSLTAPHSDTQPTTDSLPPSPSASINPTMTPTHPRTLSPSQTPTSLPTLSPAATNTTTHHQQSSTATHSRSYVPLPTATGSLTQQQQQQHDIFRTNTSSLTKALSSSRTPPLAPVVVLPVAQRPKCPTTSLAWSVNTNGTLMPISLLTDKMIRGGGVVVNITLASPSITFIRAVNVITFGVKSVGVSDPRSFPSSVDLTAITCAFDRGSFRSILCEFPPSPSYKLRTAEALSVRIAVDGTSMGACTGDGSGSTATWEAGTKTVVPAEADTLLESLQAAFAVAASVTTAIIIVFADGSPIETQVLVMIMDSPCSSNTDRASVEWIRYIVMPFYNGGSSWMMGGNILITTIVILLHSLALFILYHIRRRRLYKDKRKENKKSKKRIPTVLTSAAKNNLLRKCCTTMMYPGVSVTIAQVMYAGVAYGTMGILRTESGVPALLAVVGIMYLLFIPAAVLFILRRIAQVVYHLYKWEEEGVPASRAWLYPHGFWTPREQMYRLQGALGPYRLGKHYIVFFPFILALVSAVLLNVLAAHAPCDYLFVVMGIVCLMCGITTAIANPFRSVVQSFLTCVCLVALGLIAILQIIAMRTGLEVIVTLKGVASYILIISLAIRTAHSVFVFVIEYKYKDEAIEQLKEMGEQVSEVDEGPNEADIAEEEELIAVADAESKAVVPVEDQYPIDGAARDRNKSVSSRKSVSSDLISGLGGGRLSFIGMMGDSVEEEILGSQVRRGGDSSSGIAENTQHQQTNAYFSGVFKKEGSASRGSQLNGQERTVGGDLDDAAEIISDKAASPLRLSTFSRHNTQTLLSEDRATLGGGERLTPRANDYLLQSPRSHVHMGGPNSLSTSVNDSFLFGPTFPAFSSNAAALRTSQDGGYFNPSPANHINNTGLRNNSITSYRSNALSSYAVSLGGAGGHIVSGQGRTLSRRRPRTSSIVMLAHSKDFSSVGGGIMAPLGGVHSSLYRPRSRSVSRGGPCAFSRSARQPSAHVSDAVDMLLQQVGGVDDDESSPQESQLAASQFGSPQELLGFSLLEGRPINHHSRPNLSARGKASSGVQMDEIFGFQSINTASSGSYETRVPMTHLDVSGMGSDGVGGLMAMPPQHSSLLVSSSRPADRSNNMLFPNSTFIGSSGSINTNSGSGVFTPRARDVDDTCSPGISGNQFDSILQTATHNSVSAMTPSAWNVSTSRQTEKKRPQIHFLVDDLPPPQ